MSGATVPIIAYTQGDIFTGGLLSGGANLDYDDFFAHFQPMPGDTLVNNQIGTYPFANQATAANAIITLPLNISMMMICPARNPGDYTQKQAVLSSLQTTLQQHILLGGLFSINTPGFLYTNCILIRVSDVSGGETKQVQFRWQWDFQQPLVTQEQAAQAYGALMNKLSNGTQVPMDASNNIPNSSAAYGVGNAFSGQSPAVVPSTGTSSALGFDSSGTERFPAGNPSPGVQPATSTFFGPF